MVQTGRMVRPSRRLGSSSRSSPPGCSPPRAADSGYHYVKNSDDHTYFRVPDGWKLFDEEAILKTFGQDLSPRQKEAQRELSWQVAFDASAKPDLENILNATAKKPTGIATVEQLSQDVSDTISIEGLRNWYVPIDESLQAGGAEVREYEPIEFDGGFRGIHLVADIDDSEGRPLTFNQISLLDQTSQRIFTLLITCSALCYEDHEGKIDKVVESWTVED